MPVPRERVRLYRGVWYYPTYEDARRAAFAHGWPSDRIIEYGRGWAVQLEKSGVYLGPDTIGRRRENNPRRPKRFRKVRMHGKHMRMSVQMTDAVYQHLYKGKLPNTSSLGGYQLYYLIGVPNGRGGYDDVETVLASTINDALLGGEDVVFAVDVNYEDEDMYDGITNEKIPASYGEDEE